MRNTVFHLVCPVVKVVVLEGDHYRLCFKAPEIAEAARPGQFVNVRFPGGIAQPRAFDSPAEAARFHHGQGPPEQPFLLARPFGVHRTTPDGCVEILFKALGRGTRLLAQAQPGAKLDVLGPIGNGFDLSRPPRKALLVAGGTGIAPLYLLAQRLHEAGSDLVVLVGTGHAVPMTLSDSEQVVHFLDQDVTAVIDEYVELDAIVRIATVEPRPGCLTGTAVDLLRCYLQAARPEALAGAGLFSCGPWAMQAAVAEIAAEYHIPCKVLLEERMGCGLGACMACVVKVKNAAGGYTNKRVCVDGPVFDAAEIGWKERK